ncbi:armadillo repeat-containing protein gudu-like isoform X1 [Acropora muricata]|uniref:armadillo repeat-containing protein gudu-like isoform X1 n=2 Tax=Acropora muricata TaxID=159855 RepID=UPI0034E520E8
MNSFPEDATERYRAAEEAVRIVRKFNNGTGSSKEAKQKKMVDLCTDIADILEAKRQLEDLVKRQNTELEELRQRVNSSNTASTSGRGSLSPEETQGPTLNFASSGRETSWCHKGTDPLFEWPERPSTCTRSTSPGLLSMTSHEDPRSDVANQELEKDNNEAFNESENHSMKDDRRLHDEENEADSVENHEQNKDGDTVSEVKQAQEKEDNQSVSRSPSAKTKVAADSREERKGLVSSSKEQTEKRAKDSARKPTPKNNARQQTREKSKKYETLWKSNQINPLFSGSQSAKECKNNAKNHKKEKTTAGKSKVPGHKTADKDVYESLSSSCESEEEDDLSIKPVNPELNADYWDIHKLIKYLKYGNPTATVIALCALRDVGLEIESSQLAILEMGGVTLLLNILRTEHWRCVVGSLEVLRIIANTKRINLEICRLGGIQQLIDCLHSNLIEVQSLAAETLSHVITFRMAYKTIRRNGGIKKLVNIIQPDNKRRSRNVRREVNDFQLLRNACSALWSCSKCPKNIQVIRAAGAVPILSALLVDGKDDVVLPVMGIIQECASEPLFRQDICRKGMVEAFVNYLRQGDTLLKTLCATALFKCAEDDPSRELISRHGGLELLVELMMFKSSENHLLAAVVGAVWKCALNKSNVKRFEECGAVKALILLLKTPEQTNEVLTNALGAVHLFAYSKRALFALRDERVIPVVVQLLNVTENAVLINATKVLAVCAREAACRSSVVRTDGLRLLWSLLKFPDPKVVAGAAEAISECVVNVEESADVVRSFVGGLELVTNLLRSDDKQVLIAVNKAIVNIGKDRENLSILTDYDVVPLLIDLVNTEDEELKRWLAEAIATCSGLEKNVQSFSPVVIPFADSLKHCSDVAVKRSIACALERLSNDPYNCFLIHQHDALKTLLSLTGSQDERVQEAAAGCIKNMRVNTINILAN